MILDNQDPTASLAVHFADYGSIYTPDGREHPVTGQTPVIFTTQANPEPPQPGDDDCSKYTPGSIDWIKCRSDKIDKIFGTGPGTSGPLGLPNWLTPDWLKNQHIGARVIAIIIAIILIAITTYRIITPSK